MCSVSNAVHITRALFIDDSGSLVKITHEQVHQPTNGRTDTAQGIQLQVANEKLNHQCALPVLSQNKDNVNCGVINPQHACTEGYSRSHRFMSLRGKGSTLGTLKLLGSKFMLVCCSQDLTPLRATIL